MATLMRLHILSWHMHRKTFKLSKVLQSSHSFKYNGKSNSSLYDKIALYSHNNEIVYMLAKELKFWRERGKYR